MSKGENAGNQHFLLFPWWFLSFPNQFMFSASAFNLDQPKILSIGKELIMCIAKVWIAYLCCVGKICDIRNLLDSSYNKQYSVPALALTDVLRLSITYLWLRALKTFWEREKVLLSGYFSFPCNLFTALWSYKYTDWNFDLYRFLMKQVLEGNEVHTSVLKFC